MSTEASERARARVRGAGGPELLERLDHLDGQRRERRAPQARPPRAPDPGATVDFDVLIAGGGLWSLLAPILAGLGLRVAVLDRARAAQSHREWNASARELRALVDVGLLDGPTLERFIVARYDHGVCRFAGGGSYPVFAVLDHAVDAGALLAHGRTLAEQRGVTFLDGHAVVAHAAGPTAVGITTTSSSGAGELLASILVDARGASSPYASADLVCPTVGGVLRGLAEGSGAKEMDPRIGEILVTIDPMEGPRQEVWEGFPGRPGETTVYLFHYARADEPLSLAGLYARFFEKLPDYKRGDAELVRPTFGFIPGWSRLSPAPRSPDRRVVLVGDAAARHSPLTYCGFGATLRSLGPAARSIARAIEGEAVELACIVDDAPTHALTGALACVMAAGTCRGDEINRLLDAAFDTLHDSAREGPREAGDDDYARLLRDEMSSAAFVSFLRRTAVRHPPAWGHFIRALGPWAAGRWAAGLAWESARQGMASRARSRRTA